MNPARSLALFALLSGLAACSSGDTGSPARVYTLFDFAAASEAAADKMDVPGLEAFFPDGWPKGGLPIKDKRLQVLPMFVDQYGAAYTTSEFWANYPAVWVQPMYVPVADWKPGVKPVPLDDSLPIFSVGPSSKFYSPFWQVFYVEVPAGTGKPTTVKEVFDRKLVQHEGPGRLAPLAPDDTILDPDAMTKLGHPVGKVNVRRGWVDGAEMTFLDYGTNRFEWNNKLEVIEQPLFLFVTGQNGRWLRAGVSPVGGTNPLFSQRAIASPGGRPNWGSLWHLYQVRLPDKAGVFLPTNDEFTARRNAAKGLVLPPLEIEQYKTGGSDPRVYLGQVALNAASCFENASIFGECVWLSSQKSLQDQIPWLLVRTEILVTCPFVSYPVVEMLKVVEVPNP